MCRTEWFPAPSRGRADVLAGIDDALNVLAGLEVGVDGVRREVEGVERGLGRIREVLYGNRWI